MGFPPSPVCFVSGQDTAEQQRAVVRRRAVFRPPSAWCRASCLPSRHLPLATPPAPTELWGSPQNWLFRIQALGARSALD